ELDVAHHAAERGDDRHHLDEVGIDSLDGNGAVFQRCGMTGGGDRDLQPRPRHYCFSSPAFSIRAAHLAISCFMRVVISSGVLPRASMPNCLAFCCTSGLLSASMIAVLSRFTICGGVPAGADSPFQLDTS